MTKQRYYFLFIALCVTFFSFRLTQLTTIPIFNDEAIYLDWSWRQFFTAKDLFYSLYDAKPPLLLWLFGFAGLFSPSLLLAGRVVSVFFGFFTLMGVLLVAKQLFSKQTALLASVMYIVIPLFSFYDRQALMESAIGAIGVWLFWGILQYLKTTTLVYAVFCGVMFGFGFFIKPTALLFLVPLFLFLFLQIIQKRISVQKIFSFCITFFLTGIVVLSPLFLHPLFWETLPLNQRYTIYPSLSIDYFDGLLARTVSLFSITAIHLGPLVFLSGVIGFLFFLKKKRQSELLLFFWIFLPIIFNLFINRNMIERYLVSYLPLITVSVSHILMNIQKIKLRIIYILIVFSSTFFITLIQMFSPLQYFQIAQKIYPHTFTEYTQGFSSGYGVPEAITFLEKNINKKPAFVATGLNTGNPESGVMVHFMKNPNVLVSYLESGYLKDIDTYDCISSKTPVFYVTRETDTKGLDRFLEQIYYKKNPISNFGIGIYTLKSDCVGKTPELGGFRT